MAHFREVMTSPHFSASPLTPGFPFVSPSRAAQSKSYQTFITMDPPEHGQYRRTLTKEFMAKRMQDSKFDFTDFLCFNIYLHDETAFRRYIARLHNLAVDNKRRSAVVIVR